MNSRCLPQGLPGFGELLAYNAAHFGGRIALRIDEQALSWQAFAALVRRMRQALEPLVAPGDRVAIWMHNSMEWAALFLAIHAQGAVSVPVSTRLTMAELDVILRDAGARVLATTAAYRGRSYFDEAAAHVAGSPAPLLVLGVPALGEGAWLQAGALPPPALPADLPPDLLCIQYTSGTTSTPKGVMLQAQGYLRTAAYVARCQRLTPSSRFVSAGPFFHCSGSMHALTTCLLAGCTLTSMSIWDPERFLDIVQRHRCDVAHMVYLRDVLALGDPAARTRLESLAVAHDLGSREYLLRLHDELGIPGISNIYGMTETAGQFTMWFPDDPLDRRVAANGRPQPGNAVRIVDPATGSVLGPDRAGEIQMRGPTVAPGYFNRPQANAEAFTEDGWLRSGDIGSLSADGELSYLARAKEIIRSGGENFAPAEVEQALYAWCQPGEVCVLGVPDDRLDEIPAAVVLSTLRSDWQQVLRELRQRMAGFKVPRAVYLTESFPLTTTNKVQRNVLREWIASGRLKRIV